jgi:hypothetical protein
MSNLVITSYIFHTDEGLADVSGRRDIEADIDGRTACWHIRGNVSRIFSG